MKSKMLFSGMLTFAAALSMAAVVAAQQPQEKSVRRFQEQRSARLAALNADEQNRLRAAHEKALLDQQVRAARERLQQARREFRDVMGPAMLRADPSVQPIIEKMRRSPRQDREKD